MKTTLTIEQRKANKAAYDKRQRAAKKIATQMLVEQPRPSLKARGHFYRINPDVVVKQLPLQAQAIVDCLKKHGPMKKAQIASCLCDMSTRQPVAKVVAFYLCRLSQQAVLIKMAAK